MNFIDRYFIAHPKFYAWLRVLLPNIILIIFAICVLCGCSTIKEIPVNNVTKIEYRDTTIYVRDTILVEVPKQVVSEVLPDIDTSYLETSVAKSTAYLDKDRRKLHHTLEQTGEVKTVYDTVITISYVDRYIEKEIPIEVIKEVKHIPNIFWFSIILNVVGILLLVFRIYLKMKL